MSKSLTCSAAVCKETSKQRTEKNFMNCMKGYLEAVSECTDLGDLVMFWLCIKAKPGCMQFEEFLYYQTQILNYVKNGYFYCCLELPSNAGLQKQVVLAQPKAHQGKYDKMHCLVETDMLKLQEFFEVEGCHNADACSGKYKRDVEGKKKPKEDAKDKKGGCCNNQNNCSGQYDHQDQHEYLSVHWSS